MDIVPRSQADDALFLDRLDEALEAICPLTGSWDATGSFAHEGLDGLRASGALTAPLPIEHGGLGAGTSAFAWETALTMLRRIGRASLALGRIYEGHVNALRLIVRYGNNRQIAEAARDARAGHLFAIWAAEIPATRVRLHGGKLAGIKSFASAARSATRGVVTVDVPGQGETLMLLPLEHDQWRAGEPLSLVGMRATATAPLDLDGFDIDDGGWIGVAGDYMREPEISLGAWRTLAVMSGGLEALLAATSDSFNFEVRPPAPHDLARLGQLRIAAETARHWTWRAAELGEAEDGDREAAAHYIRLARIAVEAEVARAIRLAQRLLGLRGCVLPNPVEQLVRDLSTYTHQPALDEVLDEAALYFNSNAFP